MALHPILAEKLNEAIAAAEPRKFTPRDARLPAIAGKVHAVIGMRRAGKTTFLRQLQTERRKTLSPERAVYVSFDDDRIMDLPVGQLNLLLEEYYRRFPELRGKETVHWYLDEIQLVGDWERFVRRVLDTERVEVAVSGSSARLLREVQFEFFPEDVERSIEPASHGDVLARRGQGCF